MLSADVYRIVRERLAPLQVWVMDATDYNIGQTPSYETHLLKYPKGWVSIRAANSIQTQGYLAVWSVMLEANAKSEAVAEALARRVHDQLISLSRQPTGFQLMGDTKVQDAASTKYILTFMATLRQGE